MIEVYSIWTLLKFLNHEDETFIIFHRICKHLSNQKGFINGFYHGGEFENKNIQALILIIIILQVQKQLLS